MYTHPTSLVDVVSDVLCAICYHANSDFIRQVLKPVEDSKGETFSSDNLRKVNHHHYVYFKTASV